MGVSYSIITKRKAQEDITWMEHILTLKMYGDPKFLEKEENNNFPTLNEIYDALKKSKIEIEHESKSLNTYLLKEGKREFDHILNLKDDETQFSEDFTMHYPESADETHRIETLLGIKSDIRILIKLLSTISKKCGSFFIMNPYESYFIDKDKNYEEIWKEFQLANKNNS